MCFQLLLFLLVVVVVVNSRWRPCRGFWTGSGGQRSRTFSVVGTRFSSTQKKYYGILPSIKQTKTKYNREQRWYNLVIATYARQASHPNVIYFRHIKQVYWSLLTVHKIAVKGFFGFQKPKLNYLNINDDRELEFVVLTSSPGDSALSATRCRPLNFCPKAPWLAHSSECIRPRLLIGPFKQNHRADRKCRNFKETSRDLHTSRRLTFKWDSFKVAEYIHCFSKRSLTNNKSRRFTF